MNINKIYDNLSAIGVNNTGDSVKIRTGMFTESDLINVFIGGRELYFIIDKAGLIDFMNTMMSKISQLPLKDGFNHMIDIFNLLQSEISQYYGTTEQENRLTFYMYNGTKTDDEDVRICSMSQIKGKGIAKCAEKASLANNVLLMLNNMGLFDYQVNYLNALTTLNNERPEGHAFLEFSRVNTKGETIHIVYDVTNPEIVLSNGQEYFYPAIYSLTDEEYQSFLNGIPFDNSKFMMSNYLQTKETRKYQGFSKSIHSADSLKALREEYKKMMEKPADYNFQSDDGTYSDHMTLTANEHKGIYR